MGGVWKREWGIVVGMLDGGSLCSAGKWCSQR